MTAMQSVTQAGVEDLARLEIESSGPLAAVFRAIRLTVKPDLPPEEQAWISRIEGLRSELAASQEQISVALPYPTAKEKFGVVGEITRLRSVRPVWGHLMFNLVRALRPLISLELGTAVGLSGAYQGAALDLNGGGRLLTLEGSAGVSSLAARNFAQLGLARVEGRTGLFRDTLAPALEDLRLVDFAFIDGHHDENATVAYFEQILPYVPTERVVVFDDINWSEGMKNAWQVIQQHERVATAVDVRKLGICLIGDGRQPKQAFQLPHLERLPAAS